MTVKSVKTTNSRNVMHYRHPAHRIHADIVPVLSALKHGKTRIATLRYQQLCQRLKLMYWETLAVLDVIRAKHNATTANS
jgi:hypothetical protein